MINIKKLFVSIGCGLALIISASVHAQVNITPESGWWLDPQVPGRGYAIELQDNVVFIAAFTYDPLQTDGVRRPIWFQAAGTLVGDNVFEGPFNLFENGTCVGCSYTKNSINPAEKHTVRIEFTSNTTGLMTLDGETFSIRRFNFAPSFLDPNQKFLGQWSLVMTSPTTFSQSSSFPVTGDMLVFDEIEITADHVNIWGCSVSSITKAFCSDDDKSKNLALARYSADLDEYAVLVNETNLYYRLFWLTLSSDTVEGVVDQYLMTSGSFNWDRARAARGFRSASRAFVMTGVGPAGFAGQLKESALTLKSSQGMGEDEYENAPPEVENSREHMLLEMTKKLGSARPTN